VDARTGLTLDGIRVDVASGELLPETLHGFTASSKECIHLAVMAQVLNNHEYAQQIYSSTEVFRLLELKTATLEEFYRAHPGFAGFLPWVTINGSKVFPAHDFKSRVPALDNGEMFWGALALSHVWARNYPNVLPQLRNRFDEVFWKAMIRNCRKVFFNETTGKIRAVADIRDVHADVSQNTYSNSDNYYLDDPYEGELFAWILTLFAKDQFTSEELERIWVDKRQKLQPVDYRVRAKGVLVTAERGFWFSSHEQWKLLFMPYRLSPAFARVMLNNERVRAWHSVDAQLPGMYGCQAGPADNNTVDTGYFCSGIQEVASQKITFDKLVTPYGCFPLLLASRQLGAAWLHNSIRSPAGQTQYGALEGTGLNGSLISPVLTWDTKVTAALAVMNGTWAIVQDFLEQQGLLSAFVARVEGEYGLAFDSMLGEELEIPLPSRRVTEGRADFTTCQ
jgi:hypothetical protein